VSDNLPTVTVLVPARFGLAEIKAVTAARQLDYPADKLEILVARGTQPSIQRNTGLRAAHGVLVYFLDDDSMPEPGNLRRAISHFADPKVKIVGGPNVCPSDAPALEQVFALVLSSWLAFGPSRARYTPVGTIRETGEKELILCNLIARRDAVLELGGFDEALYPNEENALMDELQKRGGRLIYDPEFSARRHPRPTLKAFSKMLLNYGRGRAEQLRVHPTFGSVLNFAPPLFCVYLLTLPAVWVMTLRPTAEWQRSAYHLPLLAYGLAVLGQTMLLISRGGFVRALKALPLLVLSHLLYGLGFGRGLFTKLKPPGERSDVPVKLEVL